MDTLAISIISILVVELLGLSLTYQAWLVNGRKYNDYILLAKNTLLVMPLIYIIFVIGMAFIPEVV